MTISSEVLKVYDLYLLLARLAKKEFSDTLAGRMLLIPAFKNRIPELIFAAGIAGAASLVVESDTLSIQEAHRGRVCEFTVNTLDEAIRILKNQLRKRQPVAVLLQQRLAGALREMLERGLQPDLIVASEDAAEPGLQAQFVARGSRVVEFAEEKQQGMLDVTWKVSEAPGLWLPKLDVLFGDLFPGDPVGDKPGDPRAHWVSTASLYLERPLQFERFVRLSGEEADDFRSAVISSVRSGIMGVSVSLTLGQDSEPLLIAAEG